MTDVELMREALEVLKELYLLIAAPVRGGRGLTHTSSEIIAQAREAITKLEERLLKE